MFVIFSNVFLPILLNIGLYTYTVRYKSGIKISGFLRNVFFFKKNILFSCSRQNFKNFPSIFSLKKIASFSCFENPKKGYHNRFMIIH
jgi:hypothetical protein